MNLYKDLDELPILNWFKVHSTGDLSYISKAGKKKNDEALKAHWRKLYDMYIEAFGFSESFLSILKKEAEIALLMIEKAETGDQVLQTHIEIRQHELKIRQKDMGKADYYETKAVMDKFFGFNSDGKKMSVMEFYSNLKVIERARAK